MNIGLPRIDLFKMPLSPARALSLVRPQLISSSCRGDCYAILRSHRSSSLQASSNHVRPPRQVFFSSVARGLQKPTPEDTLRKSEDVSEETANHARRKTNRSPAAKTSLRRVAVEAQRSTGTKHLQTSDPEEKKPAAKLVTAYTVAEQFDLAKVREILRGKGYEPDPANTGLYPQVVHIQIPTNTIYRTSNVSVKDLSPDELGDIFIFPSGTVVAWNLPEGFTSYFATRTLLSAAENPHIDTVENEDLEYIEDPTRRDSDIRGDTIILGTKDQQDQQHSHNSDSSSLLPSTSLDPLLTKVARSSCFARSTKLAVLETLLSDYIDSTRTIPTLLSRGSRLPFNRAFILRKTGQLLSLRAQLNLYSELTDSLPDMLWDSRQELKLEGYYDRVGRALDVGIRIKVLNEKMDYAQEIASVLRERLSEKHVNFLEWTIIVLISVEIGFEVLRFWKEWRREEEEEGEEKKDRERGVLGLGS